MEHTSPATSHVEEGQLDAVDAVFERFMAAEHVPGLVVGVVRRGAPVRLKAFGLADVESGRKVEPGTVFRIASMTKMVTALALLAVRDDGLVELDAPVARYVPEATSLVPPMSDCRAISVRDLLIHGAGFVTDDPWADRELGMSPAAFDRLVAAGGLFARPPGVAVEYSNLGYALLGRILTNVCAKPYQAVIGERLLQPLGLADTTFDFGSVAAERRARGHRWEDERWSPEAIEADGEFGAMGGLATTAGDYARYLQMMLDAWPPRDAPEAGPVRRATVRELGLVHAQPWLPDIHERDGEPYAVASAYGYGLISSRDVHLGRTLHHAGGLPGYGSHVLFAPDAGIGIFAFANRTYAPVFRATRDAALRLQAAGLWTPRPIAMDDRLRRAANLVLEAYRQARIEVAAQAFASNLLADQSADRRDAVLAAARARFGDASGVRVEPRHALAGRLVIDCVHGELAAELSLAPGPEPRIQVLTFENGR